MHRVAHLRGHVDRLDVEVARPQPGLAAAPARRLTRGGRAAAAGGVALHSTQLHYTVHSFITQYTAAAGLTCVLQVVVWLVAVQYCSPASPRPSLQQGEHQLVTIFPVISKWKIFLLTYIHF